MKWSRFFEMCPQKRIKPPSIRDVTPSFNDNVLITLDSLSYKCI